MATTYQRTQPHLNIGTIGQMGHGKTTLTAALGTVLAGRYGGAPITVAELDDSDDEIAAGSTIDTSRVGYRSAVRHYAHIDCPGNVDYIADMISGASQMDAAILVVSATEGLGPQTREHLALARQQGAGFIIPFINKCDVAGEEQALAQLEASIRSLLLEYDFPGDSVPVVRGSALGALGGDAAWQERIVAFAAALDAIPEPPRYTDDVFVMPVDKVVLVDGLPAVTGRIQRGTVKAGDTLEFSGRDNIPGMVTCNQVRMLDSVVDQGQAGDAATIFVRGIRSSDFMRGTVLAKPNTQVPRTKIIANLYVLSREEGGRDEPFEAGYATQIYVGTREETCTITALGGAHSAFPGSSVDVTISMSLRVPMPNIVQFCLREGGRTVALGIVTEIIR